MSDFDSFLDGIAEQPQETEVVEQEPAEANVSQPSEAAQEVQPVTPPITPVLPAPDVEGFKAAMIAERRKRQELEAQLAAQKEEERPYLGEDYEARFKETEARFQEQLTKQKLDLSESFARSKHSDFDEKLDLFSQLVSQNPQLYTQMAQQVDPAGFAYKVASDQIKMREMANPEEYEAKLAARIRAEVMAELAVKKVQQVPPTLADARGGAGGRQSEWSGPASIKDILK